MPLLWGNTRCAEAAGWEDRVARKLTVAGGVGVAVGSVLSVLQQQPLARFTAASTASFLMLAGCFSLVQEASRLVRCRDSPLNSVAAGAATGALLYKSHGRSGGPGAIICAALGGGVHLAAARVDAAGGLQQLLVSMDLLDPPPQQEEQQQEQQEQEEQQREASAPRPWWHQYLPVQKMSEEEWQTYKGQQDDAQRKRIEAALAGGLPVMVDRKQEQPQQEGDKQ
ncbi:mitochondrial import inner membrane translocase subunit Tim17-A [Micractinium conductrix]|uniref:Mitochondrial import inner membrane translocase subunit Tim17-A n=1 Tax=Micractinium conductrix TaxID=554055 RepID=A0A2P6V202_9CHLO|nr:mitochondrial import inner membrane translocase subunit Tim17-A [Micractinium conductrix]|eukprot:PSC68115.1 mitochondrial import inner membrane translocase subunit Tim17-A [Micractinium conductrix]